MPPLPVIHSLDYQRSERPSTPQPQRGLILLGAALSALPVIVGFVYVRLLLSRLQHHRGGEILSGTPLEHVFLTANNNTFAAIVIIEILLAAFTITRVISKKWSPLALLILPVNAVALFGGLLSWFALGCEGSP